MTSSHKLWGGRFTSSTDPTLEELNASLHIDRRLYAEDIAGSQAYARCLNKTNLLTDAETKSICDGLDKVKEEWASGNIEVKPGDEDIHTLNERRLKELIGVPATKLHVGRSRNDQVITDMKLWLCKALKDMHANVLNMIEVMMMRAVKEVDIIMPGYTHMQRAQPVRWSHWLLSHTWNLKADADRLTQIMQNVNIMPLGSGALAGNPFSIDRQTLADDLGFNDVTMNSMQAVGDRDYVAEFLFWCSMTSVHLSRLAEDLIIYSTKEFNFVTIDDSFSTGSSLMPQKRNPDSLELIRGTAGYIFGQCSGFMMTLKSLPSTYNKDLQSDKEAMFNSFDKLMILLTVATGTIKTLKVNTKQCTGALSFDMLATDLAYYLVRKGVAFREAHHIAGEVVREAEVKRILIHDLTLEELRAISNHFEADVSKVWNYENSVEQYQATGGTSKNSVLNQISALQVWLKEQN
ncbi:Argininosuccinate lyase [Carabus blaptoides fortunei]